MTKNYGNNINTQMTQRTFYLGKQSLQKLQRLVENGEFVSVSEACRAAIFHFLRLEENTLPEVGDVEERNGLIMEYRENKKWCAIGRITE